MTVQQNADIVVEYSAEEATERASLIFQEIVRDSVKKRLSCYVALAGGTTPHHLYQKLARWNTAGEMPWWETEIFFGDERDVPLDDVESNYRMAQRTLLDNVPIDPTRVHPMRGDADDLQAAAAEYEQTVRDTVPAGLDGMPQFDLMLLGMGADGHTASLFPGAPALDERQKLVTAYDVPVLGRRRMTFTFPLINAARNIVLLVTGDDKAQAVTTLMSQDARQRQSIPAARIAPREGKLHIVLDSAAAKLIST